MNEIPLYHIIAEYYFYHSPSFLCNHGQYEQGSFKTLRMADFLQTKMSNTTAWKNENLCIMIESWVEFASNDQINNQRSIGLWFGHETNHYLMKVSQICYALWNYLPKMIL